MKPNPLSSENHLTVPVPTDLTPLDASGRASPVRPSHARVPQPVQRSGPDVQTLSGSGVPTQAELASVRRVGRQIGAAGRARAPRAAPGALAREAQLGRRADRRGGEAEVDRARAR